MIKKYFNSYQFWERMIVTILALVVVLTVCGVYKTTTANYEYLHNKQSGKIVTTSHDESGNYAPNNSALRSAVTIENAVREEAVTLAQIGIGKSIIVADNLRITNKPAKNDKKDNSGTSHKEKSEETTSGNGCNGSGVNNSSSDNSTVETIYAGNFEGTWYCATDMGYTSAPYGSSGRTLESGYSIASNYFPQGSLLYIEGNGISGTYRVDDTGAMSANVIDFYYWDRAYVPKSFLTAGRIQIQVYLIG